MLLIYRQEGGTGSVDIPSHSGVPVAWQNTSPELAAILENLKRTEQHLQGILTSTFLISFISYIAIIRQN